MTMTCAPVSRISRPNARSLAVLALLGTSAVGCLAEMDGRDNNGPQVLAVSTDRLRIGGQLDFVGTDFVNTQKERTKIRFKGVFNGSSAGPTAVDRIVEPHWVDGNIMTWAQVGPFSNPFSSSDQMGYFDGQVSAVQVGATGTEEEGQPLPVRLQFEESIIVRALHPVGAKCSEPSRILLGGFPYIIQVEAIGFEPINFTYSIEGETADGRPRIYRQPAKGQIDTLGENSELMFAPVPSEPQDQAQVFYFVNLTISAMGTDGIQRSTALVFGVHRPIEWVDSGTFKIAEIMPAMPDSGCLTGGPNGRQYTYTETKSEERSRQKQINWNEAWDEQDSSTKTLSHDVTQGITVTNHEETSNTSTVGWNYGVNGGVNFWGAIVQASLNFNVGWNGSYSTTYTRGWSVARENSTRDSESWAFTQTRGYTLSKGGADFWTVSSSDSTSLAITGEVLAAQFGMFYRQISRIVLPGYLVAYNICGEAKTVGETFLTDYQWAVDLAAGPTCDPAPQTKLPEATCKVPPCDGGGE